MSGLKKYSKRTNLDVSSPAIDKPYIETMFVPKSCTGKPEHKNSKSVIRYRLPYNNIPPDLFTDLIKECCHTGLYLTSYWSSYWSNGLEFQAYSGLFAVVEIKHDDIIYAEFYSTNNEKAYTLFFEFRKLLRGILEVKEDHIDYIYNYKNKSFGVNRMFAQIKKKNLSDPSSDDGTDQISLYTLFGIKQDDILEMNNFMRLLGIDHEANLPDPKPQKQKQDWVRNTEGWKNLAPYLIPAALLILIILLITLNPTWKDEFFDIFSKMKGCGG